MLNKKEIDEFRELLKTSKRPLFFFDDDTDGTCSFLLAYRYVKQYAEDSKGVLVNTGPELKGDVFISKIQEFNPDRIFVLDKAIVSQDFIDESLKDSSRQIVWLDHHPLVKRDNIKYFNPLKHKSAKHSPDNRPTSYWMYKIVEHEREDDLWIATCGCIGDWYVPDFMKKFIVKYPDMLQKNIGKEVKDAGYLLHETELGKLCRIIEFNVKAVAAHAMASVKILTRISGPYEILNQESSQGKYIYKQYLHLNEIFVKIISQIKVTDDPLVLFENKDNNSLTQPLSTELGYYHPEKVIIIARHREDGMKCSLRSQKLNIRDILEKSLIGIDGHGGGHSHACGAGVSNADFPRFIENFRKNVHEVLEHYKK